MLHELRVRQIDLELQNEELRASPQELVASRARYFDLYHLAPVGYCTLSKDGLIPEGQSHGGHPAGRNPERAGHAAAN